MPLEDAGGQVVVVARVILHRDHRACRLEPVYGHVDVAAAAVVEFVQHNHQAEQLVDVVVVKIDVAALGGLFTRVGAGRHGAAVAVELGYCLVAVKCLQRHFQVALFNEEGVGAVAPPVGCGA